MQYSDLYIEMLLITVGISEIYGTYEVVAGRGGEDGDARMETRVRMEMRAWWDLDRSDQFCHRSAPWQGDAPNPLQEYTPTGVGGEMAEGRG